MSPDEYREAIDALGLSQVKAGRFLGINQRTSRTWAAKGAPPSASIALAALVFIKSMGIDPFAVPSIMAATPPQPAKRPKKKAPRAKAPEAV